MPRSDILIIDGHAFSWQRLLELRREQLKAWHAEQCRQPTLFDLRHDSRPEAERTASGRYREPTLFSRSSP
jgi:hypothetical protein